ncbi:MAG: hypothetical protein LIO93_06740, partial [Bacteroidales bacterium]|nr:hypothetical protein [Bacteroidales bacterium]
IKIQYTHIHMKTIDFTKIKVEVSYDGKTETINIAKDFANFCKMRAIDIGLEEFCRTIYFSTGEIEVPQEYVAPLVQILSLPDCPIFAFIKKELIKLLKEQ